MKRIRMFACMMLSLAAASGVSQGDVLRPASERFAPVKANEKQSDEVPDFQRHVLPVMTRMGCNGRACHGSFQGQGGFRLSLFGYDFQADLDAMKGGDEPRINEKSPAESLILQKPTLQVDHDGGERMKVGTWQYEIMHRWLAGGAKGVADDAPHFVRLEVEPREIVFKKKNEKLQLRAIAHWSDGTQEDVTPLCRYRSNDDSVADVTEEGLITCLNKGDTHVVAFYDNGVAPVLALLPVSDKVDKNYPKVPAPTKIDQLVVAKLKKLGMVPSDECSDAEFLRRASLDVTGTLPTATEVESFLADKSADKRAKKIDELLARPGYAAWWATRLCDITGNNPVNSLERNVAGEQSREWYAWIEKRIEDNTPYDKMTEGIVTAVSRNEGESYQDYCKRMSAQYKDFDEESFAETDSMPHFWTRRMNNTPKDMALRFAHSFLGVRLQCAECHKHPFDQWTKQDFDQFTQFFTRVGAGIQPSERDTQKKMLEELGVGRGGAANRQIAALLKEGKTIPFSELYISPERANNNRRRSNANTSNRVITPKLLGDDEVELKANDDPRNALMSWMRQKDNPYFARAIVCRVWANYFGVGIVEPPDDQSLANPPSNQALLDYLVQGFIDHDYDLRWLHKEILNSRTYQLSWKTNETNELDRLNFSHALTRRMPAELVVDALAMATASDADAEEMVSDMSKRTIGPGSASGFRNNRGRGDYMLSVFGKPPRVESCDCERNADPSLLQTMFLRNDGELLGMIDRSTGWTGQVLSELGVKANSTDPMSDETAEKLVRSAYLRTLSRVPSDDERERALGYVREAPSPSAAARDLLWALVNTKEFILNH